MTSAAAPTPPPTPATEKSMEEIVSLCKRRGFIFPASEIYGGINGFWDYGPLGAALKRNLREAWWRDCVMTPPTGPDGKPVRIVPVDSCIIQNPRVWQASGHVGGFNDPMVDCKETKARYRADHLSTVSNGGDFDPDRICVFINGDDKSRKRAVDRLEKHLRYENVPINTPLRRSDFLSFDWNKFGACIVGPDTDKPGTLTEARAFNLMFKTYVGANATEDDVAYLRPETAQGIFINFKNVVDTMRVKVPFGIAQVGKAFRNEVTPRNFTFRSREFEQMEIEFFCHPDQAKEWYIFWRDWRMAWWHSVGLTSENLRLREHDCDELAHYAKAGAGTSDIEYRFPFTAPDFGELEGVADRSTYDLTQHETESKSKLQFFDQERGEIAKNGQPKGEWFTPNVIEPSAGLDRGTLAVLCEAFTPDPERPSKVFMRFHPRLAPIKAAVFPLVNKDGMPEVAEKLHAELLARFGHLGAIEFDVKQSIGKRYARMDEAGCPFCFTIDGDTLTDQTVTMRDRDTASQERMNIDNVCDFVADKLQV